MNLLKKNSILLTALFLPFVFGGLTGCSIFMAANQPDYKDLSLLAPMTPRKRIVKEFGQPVSSRLVGMNRVDLLSFTQGYSKEAKVGRAFAHGAMDVATGGVWEVAGTPTEVVFSGKKLTYEVTYDRSNRVIKAVHIGE